MMPNVTRLTTRQFEAAMAALILTITANSSVASDSFIILGPARVPEYAGSNDYVTVPMLVTEFRMGSAEIEVEGTTAYASAIEGSLFSFGVSASIDSGRDAEVADPQVARLDGVDVAFDLGPYLKMEKSGLLFEPDELQLRVAAYTDVNDAHQGAWGNLVLTYGFLRVPWRLEIEAETVYANDAHMSTYFGIGSAGTAQSGLAAHAATAGVREVSLTANAILFLNPQFGLFTRFGVGRLLGDAADSPIGKNPEQYFAGIGFIYRFGI